MVYFTMLGSVQSLLLNIGLFGPIKETIKSTVAVTDIEKIKTTNCKSYLWAVGSVETPWEIGETVPVREAAKNGIF